MAPVLQIYSSLNWIVYMSNDEELESLKNKVVKHSC